LIQHFKRFGFALEYLGTCKVKILSLNRSGLEKKI